MSSIRLAYVNHVATRTFLLEKDEWAIMEVDRETIALVWPLSHVGRKGKVVNKRIVYFPKRHGARYDWRATLLDRVSDANSLAAAQKTFDNTIAQVKAEEALAFGNESLTEVKGIDKSLPTPTYARVQDIEGSDVTVKLNEKPIEVYVQSWAAALDRGYQTYDWEIDPRYKNTLNRHRDTIAAAQGRQALEQILDDIKVPYKNRIRMQLGRD
jgi:hypothetical protein